MDRMCSWRLCVSIASCGRKLADLEVSNGFCHCKKAGDESREHLFQPRCFINIYDASLHAQTRVNYPNSMHRCTNYMVPIIVKKRFSGNITPQHQPDHRELKSFNLENFWPFPTGKSYVHILHFFWAKLCKTVYFSLGLRYWGFALWA